LTAFKRTGKIQAVVEFVANAGRFKLYVPKEGCKLTFVLAGVKCPRMGRTESEKGDPFGLEAAAFVSSKCLQHDVEIEVENVDKTGGFIGTMWLKDRDS
jgi:staphylococcal nuclease domain-containing protein 1